MVHFTNRIIAIDFMKFLAVILVMNSHMDICYAHFSQLSSGGILGDALFFFASGFGLFLGKPSIFVEWYKRRIRRIFPSVIAASIVALLLFDYHEDIADVFLCRRYWFLQCIFLYYLFLYPLKRYGNGRFVPYVFWGWLILGFLVYCLLPYNERLFYGGGMSRIMVFFLFMLLGAHIGRIHRMIVSRWWHFPMCFVCLVTWAFSCVVLKDHFLYYFTIVPFLGFCYFAYLSLSSSFCKKIYNSRIVGTGVFVISQLCLECYLIQKFCYSDVLNFLFPLNLFIFMGVALCVSYFVKIVSEFIIQTFDSGPYNWKKVLTITK